MICMRVQVSQRFGGLIGSREGGEEIENRAEGGEVRDERQRRGGKGQGEVIRGKGRWRGGEEL